MTSRDWMTLALRVLGVWFAVLTFVAVLDVLTTFFHVSYLLARSSGSFGSILGLIGGSLINVLKFGAPAGVLLMFTTRITDHFYAEGDEPSHVE